LAEGKNILLERKWHSAEDGGWFATEITVFKEDGLYKVTTRGGYGRPLDARTFIIAGMPEDTSELPPSGEIEGAFLSGLEDDKELLEKDYGFVFPKEDDVRIRVEQRVVLTIQQDVFASTEGEGELKAANEVYKQAGDLGAKVEDVKIIDRQVIPTEALSWRG
jgi:hypothetical protein